jgi:hypothetical protein
LNNTQQYEGDIVYNKTGLAIERMDFL